jgi:hypothetical protein
VGGRCVYRTTLCQLVAPAPDVRSAAPPSAVGAGLPWGVDVTVRLLDARGGLAGHGPGVNVTLVADSASS